MSNNKNSKSKNRSDKKFLMKKMNKKVNIIIIKIK